MLVLSRKKNECILIKKEGQPDIKVTIVRIDSKTVRVGIEADQNTTVLRSELLNHHSETHCSNTGS